MNDIVADFESYRYASNESNKSSWFVVGSLRTNADVPVLFPARRLQRLRKKMSAIIKTE